MHPRNNSASQALEKASALLKVAQSSSSRYNSPRSSPSRNHSNSQINTKYSTQSKSRSKKYDWEDSDDEDGSLFGDNSHKDDDAVDSDKDSESAELQAYLSGLAKKKAAEALLQAAGSKNPTASAKSSYIKKPPPPPSSNASSEAFHLKDDFIKSMPSTPKTASISKLDQQKTPFFSSNASTTTPLGSKIDNGSNTSINSKLNRLSESMNASKSLLSDSHRRNSSVVGGIGDLESGSTTSTPARRASVTNSPLRSPVRSSPIRRNIDSDSSGSDIGSSTSDLNTSEMGSSRSMEKSSNNRKSSSSYLKQSSRSDSDDSDAKERRRAKPGSSKANLNDLISDTKPLLAGNVPVITTTSAPSSVHSATPVPTPTTKTVADNPKIQIAQQHLQQQQQKQLAADTNKEFTSLSEISEEIDRGESSIAEEIESDKDNNNTDNDETRSKFNDLLTIEDLVGGSSKPKPEEQQPTQPKPSHTEAANHPKPNPSSSSFATPPPDQSRPTNPPLTQPTQSAQQPPTIPQLYPSNLYPPYPYPYPYPPANTSPDPCFQNQPNAQYPPPPPAPPNQYWAAYPPYNPYMTPPPQTPYNPQLFSNSLYGAPSPYHYPGPSIHPIQPSHNLWMGGGSMGDSRGSGGSGNVTFVNPYLSVSGGDSEGPKSHGLRRCDHSCGCIPPESREKQREDDDEAIERRRRRRGSHGRSCSRTMSKSRRSVDKKGNGEKEARESSRGGGGKRGGSYGRERKQSVDKRKVGMEDDISSYGGSREALEVEDESHLVTESSSGSGGGVAAVSSSASSSRKSKDGKTNKEKRNVKQSIEDGKDFWSNTISPLMSTFDAANASYMIQQYVRMNERLLQEEVYHTQEYVTLKSTKEEIKQKRKESMAKLAEFEREVQRAQESKRQ
ncbi:UNVERIFIED_CONTAM: hypothetical protein HDU68_012404 [Siphonaria sp. JEL0065]|nr:hypothetical protein HDU68_012404 [Siphonaria sp. JEL0065]